METERTESRSAKLKYWQEHIHSWEKSGTTQSSYCRENLLSLATFGYWRRKCSLKAIPEQPPKFFPLSVKLPVPERQGAVLNVVRLILQDRRFLIEVEGDFSPSTLQRLVTTLEQL